MRNRALKEKLEVAGRAALADHVHDRALAGFGYAPALEQFHERAVGGWGSSAGRAAARARTVPSASTRMNHRQAACENTIDLSSSPALALVLDPPVQGLVGLVERVFEIIVLGMKERLEGDLLRLGNLVVVKKAERTDRFEPHARVLVVDLLAQAARADR